MFQVISGAGLAAFVLGGLAQRVAAGFDPLPEPVEALLLGLLFVLASLPGRLAWLPRAILPLAGFAIFYAILAGKRPPVPFGVAVACAAGIAAFLAVYSVYLARRARPPAG